MKLETPSPGNVPGIPADAMNTKFMPTDFRVLSLSDAQAAALNLYELIDTMIDAATPDYSECPRAKDQVNKLSSLLWIARHLAEVMAWKLERLERQELQRGRKT